VANLTKPSEPVVPSTNDELRAFLKRTEAGDKSTLPVLRKMLENPSAISLFSGDAAALAERSFLDALGGNNLGFKEALARKMELMRTELAGPNPTPLERLLIERIVACWLQVQDADSRYAQAKDLNRQWLEFFIGRMDRANKRYLAALKTLAQIRKLAVPVLQFNIAKKQTNIAAGAVVSDNF